MRDPTIFISVLLTLGLGLLHSAGAQDTPTNLDRVYADQNHCLAAPEIRTEKDKPISCFCRDDVVIARYVWQTYLVTEKDPNLTGAYLSLEIRAAEKCGEHYDVSNAVQLKNWRWTGPDVLRVYPPDNEIQQIRPDGRGFRTVEYKVRLTYRDRQGNVTKVENFAAFDRLPPNPKK